MNICESKYCFCFEYLMIKLLCVSNSPCNFLKTTEILFCSSNFGRRICMFPIVLFISFGFAKLVETYILVASAKTNETKWASIKLSITIKYRSCICTVSRPTDIFTFKHKIIKITHNSVI